MLWLVVGSWTGCGPVAIEPADREDPPEPTEPCFGGVCVPSPASGTASLGGAQVAMHGSEAWISWVTTDAGVVTGLFVARSPTPGAPLEAPIAVPVPEAPILGSTEKPSLAIHGDRVALTYTARGVLRHGDASVLYVQLGTLLPEGGVAFEDARLIDAFEPGGSWVLEQPRAAFAPDGELWVFWKRQEYGTLDLPTWGRESLDFVGAPVDPALSNQHDCSPPDFSFAADGTSLLALRSNVDGFLQTVIVSGDGQGGATSVVVSDDVWAYSGEVCPDDGPRVVALADGTWVASWIRPDTATWRMFSSWSTDRGATWTAPVMDFPEGSQGERWVALGASSDGRFLSAIQDLGRTTRLLVRDAPGEPLLEDRLLLGADGSQLTSAELAASDSLDGPSPGRVVLVAIGDGAVWLLDL